MPTLADTKPCRLRDANAVLKQFPRRPGTGAVAPGGSLRADVGRVNQWVCTKCGYREPFDGEIET